jgi:LCP family protein required for cell wall assembly
MSDTSTKDFYTRQAKEARGPEQPGPSKQKQRRKKVLRIAVAAASSLVVLAGALVGGTYWYVNHEVGSIQRIHVAALDAKTQAAFPGGTSGSLNVLLTASGWFPRQDLPTGLIEVLHLNANRQGGAVISFPANLVVDVPGHGDMRLGETLKLGGPSLMIRILEKLTDVRIEHYSKMDYPGLPKIVGALGGVYVYVPYATTSFGFHFHAGRNHITQANALAYVRQVAVSQVTRTALQENLFRAILHKIANERYFVATDWHVLNAVVRAVSVDSDLSNSQLEHLALSLGHLTSSSGVSIDVPTVGSPDAGFNQPVDLNKKLARKLWRAVRDDSVAQLAKRYPSLVTPIAPG